MTTSFLYEELSYACTLAENPPNFSELPQLQQPKQLSSSKPAQPLPVGQGAYRPIQACILALKQVIRYMQSPQGEIVVPSKFWRTTLCVLQILLQKPTQCPEWAPPNCGTQQGVQPLTKYCPARRCQGKPLDLYPTVTYKDLAYA